MNRTKASLNALDIEMHQALAFTKMQALGNDFVFVEQAALAATSVGARILENLPVHGAMLARHVCDRHRGIGADGLIVVGPPTRPDCDVAWTYFNSDGSISAMCGNGIRCLGLYAWEAEQAKGRLLDSGHQFTIETAVGAVPVIIEHEDSISSDLGEPILEGRRIPVAVAGEDTVVKQPLTVAGHSFEATCVSMGNPHCVIFDGGIEESEWARLAPQIQASPFFPEGVNVEFVDVLSPQLARVYVWERGCGPTLACASGAAAVLVAGVLEGRLQRQATIELPGGPLQVSWSETDRRVRITGPARVAFCGEFDLARYWPGGAQ